MGYYYKSSTYWLDRLYVSRYRKYRQTYRQTERHETLNRMEKGNGVMIGLPKSIRVHYENPDYLQISKGCG